MEFCTLLDRHFVLRCLALIRSLERQGTPFRLWVLCADDEALTMFEQLAIPSVQPFSLREVEESFPELPAIKSSRGPYEYIATVKPFLLRAVMEKLPEGALLTYLDADLYFFDDPRVIEEEIGNGALLLTPHGFPEHLKSREQNGVFNAGFLAVKNTEEGRRAIRWWCDRCVEWCYDRVEAGRSSNQKYLDEFPKLFTNVRIAHHPGLNLAPWNIDTHAYSWNGDRLLVDQRPLIFYHFHGLKRLAPWLLDTGLATYHMRGSRLLSGRVYAPYLRELRACRALLKKQIDAGQDLGSVRTRAGSPVTLGLAIARLRRRQWLISP